MLSYHIYVQAMLMPAVYQLVPGSMIAKLWFNSIFPPPLETQQVINITNTTNGTIVLDSVHENYEAQANVFSNLMVISTSLALGLLVGFAIVDAVHRAKTWVFALSCFQSSIEKKAKVDGVGILCYIL